MRRRHFAWVAVLTAPMLIYTPTPAFASGTHVTVLAAGQLQNPRGIAFGPDGQLYVAEGGTGGTHQTVGQCRQVPAPVGPYSGDAHNSRISKVNPWTGAATIVASGLPSSQTSPSLGSLISGVSDVAFVDGKLYALLAGAGCSHGVPQRPNGIVRINADGSNTDVANLSHFIKTHPVKHPNPPDFEPDGTWFSMVVVNDKIYAVEPNHGEVDIASTNGNVDRLVDVSASQGHIVPTAIAYHDGNFYLGNLDGFAPGEQGHSKIFKLTPSGHLSVVADSLYAVTGVAFDDEGRLYALESFTGSDSPTPGTGQVVRLTSSGTWKTVVSGLSFATAMTFGPHDNLYISNFGYGPPTGEIWRVKIAD